MRTLMVTCAALAVASCSTPSQEPSGSAPAKSTVSSTSDKPAVEPDSVAYFAGGCFWGVEHFLEKLDGVASVESGYMGGHVESPSYEDVTSKKSGHLESVRVRYDSARISFRALAKRFFEIHDPTQKDGQGPDIGPQYRSAVFYASADEKAVTEELIGILRKRGYDVATELVPVTRFWPAEEYHQDYYARSGKQPYCHAPVDRFGD